MKPLHHQTPLWESRPLGARLGARVWLKLEAFQPTGSFKIRGVGHACQSALSDGARALVASSGGNAGYAVAYAGRQLGLPVTVVVPQTTSSLMLERLRGEGATVMQQGAAWDDSHAVALDLARRQEAAYIHPFDDSRIWAGHASLVREVGEAGVKPDRVVLAVGGGGLLCGVLEGMHRAGWQKVPVCAVETEGADSLYRSVRAGRLVTLPGIASLATSLGARQVASQALAWTRSHRVLPWVVSDRAAVGAVLRFADDHRLLVEPACGAALASVYDRAEPLRGAQNVLVVVCGGAGVTRQLLAKWSSVLGL